MIDEDPEFTKWFNETVDPHETGRSRMLAHHAFLAGRAAAKKPQDDDVPTRPPDTLRRDPATGLKPKQPRVDEVPRGSFYCQTCQRVVRMRHSCPGQRRQG